MAEKRKLEFFVLRYVPNAVSGEFVNFGLVMIETPKAGFADVRFTRDWRRLECLDPQADIEVLQALERDIRQQVVEVRDCSSVMRWLNDSFSNQVQLSESKGCLTDDPTKEIEVVARMYLESPQVGRTRVLSEREKIVVAMQDAWEAVGLSGLIKQFPVATYTGTGDSFRFDFGYLIGNQVKLFHAVSLKTRVDSAVMLASRFPKIAELMRTHGKFPLMPSLTAVVDNDVDREKEEIGFALAMMEESQIRVAEVRIMPEIAAAARVELGA
jgi:Protein of unknown function (DUF3037)